MIIILCSISIYSIRISGAGIESNYSDYVIFYLDGIIFKYLIFDGLQQIVINLINQDNVDVEEYAHSSRPLIHFYTKVLSSSYSYFLHIYTRNIYKHNRYRKMMRYII